MCKLIYKVIAFIKCKDLVLLTDFQNTKYFSFRSRKHNRAFVYPFTCTGKIVLKDDNTVCDPEGRTHYVETWKKV